MALKVTEVAAKAQRPEPVGVATEERAMEVDREPSLKQGLFVVQESRDTPVSDAKHNRPVSGHRICLAPGISHMFELCETLLCLGPSMVQHTFADLIWGSSRPTYGQEGPSWWSPPRPSTRDQD